MRTVSTIPSGDRTISKYTLPCALEKSVKLYGDKMAVSTLDGPRFTYTEFYETITSLSLWLAEQGITQGDKVALVAENSPHWVISYFATTCIGAVAVPILTEFHPDAIAHIIRHSEAKAIFISEKYLSSIEDFSFEHAPIIVDIDTFELIELNGAQGLQKIKETGLREFRKLKEKAKRAAFPTPTIVSEDDLAAIIYTSGTTGHSKGVMLTHKNIVFTAAATDSVEYITSKDIFLSVLPLAHSYECTLGMVLPLIYGASVVYLTKPPTARVLLPALAKVKPTVILSVPLIIEKIYKNGILPKFTSHFLIRCLFRFYLTRRFLVRAAGKRLFETFGGNIRALVISGAPLAADVEKFLYLSGFPYIVGYGSTETSPTCTASKVISPILGGSGQRLNGVSIRIIAPDEEGVGEVEVAGDNIMLGYFKQPELTEEVLTEDGWFKTGDLGKLDKDSNLHIKGRSKNMILGPSGENIYPEEIESIFFKYPAVEDVLVYVGEEGKLSARVHLNTDYLDIHISHLPAHEQEQAIGKILEELRASVNSKVSSFARIIKIVHQVEPFEKTPTKKIKRYLYVGA